MSPTGRADATDAPAAVFLAAMYYLYRGGDDEARKWIETQGRNAECIAKASLGLYEPAYTGV